MRTDLIWRALVPVAALVALLLDAPGAVPGVVGLLGLALSADRLALLRGLGLADRVLVGLGGVVVALVLAGMLMGSTPIGLSPTSWVAAVTILALAGLVVAAVLPARTTPVATGGQVPTRRTTRRTAVLLLPWVAAAVVVAALSVRMSATSLAEADAAPVQMSFGRVSGTEVQVVVSSSDAVGPLEVRASADGNETSYPLFSLDEDGSTTTTVSLPRTGRYVITLNYPDQTQPLRSLVLDR